MRPTNNIRWLLPIVLFSAMAVFIWRLVEGTPHVETLLLTDAKSNWQPKTFTCPRGSNFYVVFGVPKNTAATAGNISGTVAILSNETLVTEIPFETQRSTEASWLDKHQLQAFALNWPTSTTPFRLDGRLMPDTDYQVKVEIRSPAAVGSSWLVFTQTQRDKRRP